MYHIVRKEERSGAKWYELTHDRLIKPIMNSNKKWKNALEKEKDKAFSELWQKAIAINARKISTNQLENLDQDKILAVFYEEVIKQAIKKTRISEDHLRRWFEKTLITSTGTLAVTPRGLDSTAGMINTVLDFLEERSVITGKLRFGTKWYELSHDRLIQPIIESNKEWKQNSQLTKQLKKTKQKFAIISTVVAIAAITVVFLYFQSTIPQPSSACYPFKTETLNPDAFLKIGSPPNLLSIYPKNNYLMFVEENKNSPIISILNCQSYKPKFNITTRGEILDYTFDESKNMLYVANVNGISIYNLHDPTRSIASIPIIYPSALSINPSENRLYVASKNTNSVTIFDIANKKLVQNFTSDKGINLPDDIEFNSFDNKIYVANSGSNSVSVIDEKNNNSSTINTCDQKYCRNDGPHRLSINNHLNKIYMSNYPNHTISVINGNNYAVKNILVGRGPSDLAYDAKNDLLYVLNNLSNSISVIDGASDRVTRVIPLAVEISPVSIAVDPDSGLVYLASDDIYGSIRIIGPVENADYIQIGLDPKYLGLNNVTRKLYVSNYDTGKITVLNENTADFEGY